MVWVYLHQKQLSWTCCLLFAITERKREGNKNRSTALFYCYLEQKNLLFFLALCAWLEQARALECTVHNRREKNVVIHFLVAQFSLSAHVFESMLPRSIIVCYALSQLIRICQKLIHTAPSSQRKWWAGGCGWWALNMSKSRCSTFRRMCCCIYFSGPSFVFFSLIIDGWFVCVCDAILMDFKTRAFAYQNHDPVKIHKTCTHSVMRWLIALLSNVR